MIDLWVHKVNDQSKSVSPCLCLGSQYEDLKEKYNEEVEERKRLEGEVKALQARVSELQALQPCALEKVLSYGLQRR